jgi:hypothetical protein
LGLDFEGVRSGVDVGDILGVVESDGVYRAST